MTFDTLLREPILTILPADGRNEVSPVGCSPLLPSTPDDLKSDLPMFVSHTIHLLFSCIVPK